MRTISVLLLASLLIGCGTARYSFDVDKKYTREVLEKDYAAFKNTLETHHPSLYWYTPKDSMDYYFTWGKKALQDSMTEPEFRNILAYVTAKINCGHTSVRSSKRYSEKIDTAALKKIFPLSFKFWEDTMVVTANLNRTDSLLKRGTIITSLNGFSPRQLCDTLFQYLCTDGYNQTHKFQTLSNRGVFGAVYAAIFGLADSYAIEYIDSLGIQQKTIISVYRPVADTAKSAFDRRVFRPETPYKERRNRRLNSTRLLQIDTAGSTALMTLSSFSKGFGLPAFFKRSFKTLRKNKIQYLIIDVRSNGGGTVSNSTSLTKYIVDKRFKIADSLFAIKKKSPFSKYIENSFWNRLFLSFFAKKKNNSQYHLRYFERKYFIPRKKNHFNNNIFLLTGGNSFSATTLLASAIKGQKNVVIVGEETGGGGYGNSAWLIPDIILPVTKVRVRLPLFRLVISKSIPKNGRGLQPDLYALPTSRDIARNIDFKMEKVLALIKEYKRNTPQ